MAEQDDDYECTINSGCHGIFYQLDLVYILFVRALIKRRNFKIAVDMKTAYKFDDVVLILTDTNERWLIQCKHTTKKKTVTDQDLFERKDFYLPKYLDSYIKIRKQNLPGLKRFFILTNRTLDHHSELMTIEERDVDKLLNFGGRHVGLVPKEEKIKELMDILNGAFNNMVNDIIELFKSVAIPERLGNVGAPLAEILSLTGNSLTISENAENTCKDLFEECKKHLSAQNIDIRLIKKHITKDQEEQVKNLMKGDTRSALPTLFRQEDVTQFLKDFTFCVDQPEDLVSDCKNYIQQSLKLDCIQTRFVDSYLSDAHKNWFSEKTINSRKRFLTKEIGNECIREIETKLSITLSRPKDEMFPNFLRQVKCDEENPNLTMVRDSNVKFVDYSNAENLYENVRVGGDKVFEELKQNREIRKIFLPMVENAYDDNSEQLSCLVDISHQQLVMIFWACEYKCVKIVKKIMREVSRDYKSLLSPDDFGTLLHNAARVGCVELIKYLLDTYKFDVDQRCDKFGTPLHVAIYFEQEATVQFLIVHGANVNARARKWTPLHFAANKGKIYWVKLLIERGAIVDARTFRGQTPLHLLAGSKSTETEDVQWLKLFFDRGAFINAQDEDGHTPLHFAVKKGNVKLVKEMLTISGIDVNLANRKGYTALHIAYRYEHESCLRLLLDCGADVNARSKTGETPLSVAKSRTKIQKGQ